MDFLRHRRPRGRPRHPDVLTPAEWRVLEHLRAGLTNAEIAVRTGVSVHTVKTQVSSILGKLGMADRHELAAWPGRPAEPARRRLPFGLPLFGWSGRRGDGLATAGKAVAVAGVVVLGAGALFAAIAAARDTGQPPQTGTPPVAPTETEAPEGTPHRVPTGTETGIPNVDAILRELEARDTDALSRRLRFRDEPCTHSPEGGGSPPKCEAGEPEGTIVSVLLVAACGFDWARDAHGRPALDGFVSRIERLEVVGTVRGTEEVLGRYAVVVKTESTGGRAGGLFLDEDGIVLIWRGCGQDVDQAVAQWIDEVIIWLPDP